MKTPVIKVFFLAFLGFGTIWVIFSGIQAQQNKAISIEPENQFKETKYFRSAVEDKNQITMTIGDMMRLPEAGMEH
jgi:hypothetical protein